MDLKEISKALYQERFDDSGKGLSEFLSKVGITTHNPDGSWKDMKILLNEIANVWNKLEDDEYD